MHGLKAVFGVGTGVVGFACLWTAIIPWSRLPTHQKAEDGDAEKAQIVPMM